MHKKDLQLSQDISNSQNRLQLIPALRLAVKSTFLESLQELILVGK